MREKEYAALRSALASSKMEGLPVTAQTEQDCIRLLEGKISISAMVEEILRRPTPGVCARDKNMFPQFF